MLERAQQGLHNANQMIGHIWFLICQSGVPILSKYAMRQDYSTMCNIHKNAKSAFDVDLD
ncbi:hypothetical protein PAXRUDRAFT_668637 [Paxillus rubicundulus Ve08.2h10]|uniref:Uncharacterized protein n=1 Tax=Paxillus rubicundulus Ve08.2h10 TaxID=930991 RepID=A0A0D0D521_9AGAM|nr:hypothetical protein PAXRUDRAFT_668637 [Paxillus rubicundulus Ve08.2h10]